VSNTDRAAAFLARLVNLEQERRENAEDRKELGTEMKAADLTKVEIAGIKLAVKRHFEDDGARALRESVEEFAEALGGFKDTPLGEAAIEHVMNKPGVRRAMKQSEKMKRELADLAAKGTTLTVTRGPGSRNDLGNAAMDALVEAGVREVPA